MNNILEINEPVKQLKLYGYRNYFNFFVKLYEKKLLPNCLLLNGLKGLGKSTFTYHLINYFLSKNETNSYSLKNYLINENNSSYKLLINNTHPNFYLIDINKDSQKDIKIDQIRDLLKFTQKSAFSKNFKIVLIDNAEYLNLNSANSLLKVLEEPPENTFFFIIHDSSVKLLNTIKSRCSEFKINLTYTEKKENLDKILEQYQFDANLINILDEFYFDTPGNLIKYLFIFDEKKISFKDKLSCIDCLMELYKKNKSPEVLNFISIFITKYYNDLCYNHSIMKNLYLFNNDKISKQLNQIKHYNLNEKSTFFSIKNLLANEHK